MTKTAQDIAGEAYQVIGTVADAAGLLDAPEVQAALDYFSSDLTGEILPFALKSASRERAGRSDDPDNPEWTAADFARARPVTEVFSEKAIADFRANRGKPSE